MRTRFRKMLATARCEQCPEPFPPQAYVPNRNGKPFPNFVLDAFEAILWTDLVGAEYSEASDAIFWIGLN
jgi:hypothetical protein